MKFQTVLHVVSKGKRRPKQPPWVQKIFGGGEKKKKQKEEDDEEEAEEEEEAEDTEDEKNNTNTSEHAAPIEAQDAEETAVAAAKEPTVNKTITKAVQAKEKKRRKSRDGW